MYGCKGAFIGAVSVLVLHLILSLPLLRFLKEEDLGFIAEPHVSSVEAMPSSHTCFLVAASDGLWDVISEERAAGLIIKVKKEEPQF